MQPVVESSAAEADSVANTVFQRILVPIDFSAASRRAVAVALSLRARFGSEVHLFRLAQSGENDQFLAGTGAAGASPDWLVSDAEGRVRRFVDHVVPGRSGEVIIHAAIGEDVLHGVVRMARRIGATLTLVPGEAKEGVFRSTIEKLIIELECPVMLVRPPPVS
jgi:nucleotide-binding universal stress UspA family protein